MQNAIVVFSKVPKLGTTKTRLTTDKGGILTPEEAMAFYEGCLLDVINVCIAADCGDVWVCYNQNGDPEYLEQFLARTSDRQKIKGTFTDKGGTFDDCIQYSADYILKQGSPDRIADSVMIVGGDIPSLQPDMLQSALTKMKKLAASEQGLAVAVNKEALTAPIGAAIVEGACQEGGFSIIGFTCTTPFDFYKVFYNMDGITALDMLVAKAKDKKIPLATVSMAPDVDIPLDLASIIPMVRALEVAASYDDSVLIPANTLEIMEKIGLESTTTPPQR
ncbi:MAG: transferase 1, rSAM/selenodomain-associated [Firmicutes bacterium]|nr:transferase 1, rSAM/selenodomain-associated [Bacillota bacterium]